MFACALSVQSSTVEALDDVCAQCREFVGGATVAIVFFSPHHAEAAKEIAARLYKQFQPQAMIGSIGEAIVGPGVEIEQSPALSLWLWSAPAGAQIRTFHLSPQPTPDGLSLLGWPDELIEGDPSGATLLVLGDPFTFPAIEIFLPQVNSDYRGVRVFGGMASGMTGPGETPLIRDGAIETTGAVGILLRGPVGIRGLVSQGCRPIGKPFVVTKAQDHHVLELGGRPPLEQLQGIFQDLSPRERELFQRGPHVGLVVNEYLPRFGRGDFLVRNVYAIDRASGAMTITDRVRTGQTVQFQIRDADSADEDLRLMLRAAAAARSPGAALLFTCNGRGTRMFAERNHDSGAIAQELGAIPTAGLFAAGEFGPIGGQNFLHGFTASLVLFDGEVES